MYNRTYFIHVEPCSYGHKKRLKYLTKYERRSLVFTLNYSNKIGVRNYKSARDTFTHYLSVSKRFIKVIFSLRNICIGF